MALHQTLRIPEDHILRLKIPNVPKGEEVEVLVLSKDRAAHKAKIALLAEAAQDPRYRHDMDRIAKDFSVIDSEHLR